MDVYPSFFVSIWFALYLHIVYSTYSTKLNIGGNYMSQYIKKVLKDIKKEVASGKNINSAEVSVLVNISNMMH